MKVAYVGGYWATNIGNAFFNLGADYVLKQVFGDKNVNMIFDQPAGIFRNLKKHGNPKRSANLIVRSEIDVLVLLGPVISKDFLLMWQETLDEIKSKNKKYIILSCGIMKCSDKDLVKIKDFFRKNPPYLITTRDEEAYEKLKDIKTNIYNGIDFAFFVPEVHEPVSLDYNDLLCLNFDKFFEPHIFIDDKRKKESFEFNGEKWNLKFNNLIKKVGAKTDRLTDALVYILSMLPAKDRPIKVKQYDIIRTDHRFTPIAKNKVYRYSNSFVSDIPHSYLDIYAAANLTLSDRIHACVASLAYGNSAMLFSKTNRSLLLNRVGADQIYYKPVKIDLDYLENEKKLLLQWLKSHF